MIITQGIPEETQFCPLPPQAFVADVVFTAGQSMKEKLRLMAFVHGFYEEVKKFGWSGVDEMLEADVKSRPELTEYEATLFSLTRRAAYNRIPV